MTELTLTLDVASGRNDFPLSEPGYCFFELRLGL
jgi:hypothetical protein